MKARTVQAPCNECTCQTEHNILKMHKTSEADSQDGTWCETVVEMIECRGCHFISLKRTFIFSEYNGPQIEYFPPPISRRKPGWWSSFLLGVPCDLDLPELFEEVYSTLHANNRRLATMGARAILDVVIVHCIGDAGTFHQKLDALQKEDFINKRQRDFLDAALNAGNAATHRGHCPSAAHLNRVMDIVEHVVEQIFVLPHATEELKKATPARRKGGPARVRDK
jgi:hypothetical protein